VKLLDSTEVLFPLAFVIFGKTEIDEDRSRVEPTCLGGKGSPIITGIE